jgi:uncharacterized membrane protein YqiK
MAKIKTTSQWEAEHKAESERVLAEAEESIRKFEPSKLGQELMQILEQADSEGVEPWTEEDIEQYINGYKT